MQCAGAVAVQYGGGEVAERFWWSVGRGGDGAEVEQAEFAVCDPSGILECTREMSFSSSERM